VSIEFEGSGAFATGTTSVTPPLPAHAAGDVLIAHVSAKPVSTGTPPVFSTATDGWAEVPDSFATSDSGVAQGSAVGQTWEVLFYKVAESSAEDDPVITVTNGNTAHASAVCFSKTNPSNVWDVTGANGGRATNSTTFFGTTPNFEPDVDLGAGDMVFVAACSHGSSTRSAQTITADGMTFGTYTEIQEANSAIGNDISSVTYYAEVTAGIRAIVTVDHNSTSSSGMTGAFSMARLKEVTGGVEVTIGRATEADAARALAATKGLVPVAIGRALEVDAARELTATGGIPGGFGFGMQPFGTSPFGGSEPSEPEPPPTVPGGTGTGGGSGGSVLGPAGAPTGTYQVISQTRDGEQVAELVRATDVVFTERLNQPGACSFRLPGIFLPDADGNLTVPLKTVLEDGVHEIGVRRNGALVWLGPLTAVEESIDEDGRADIAVSAEGLASYLWRWKIDVAGRVGPFTDTDQAIIAKALVDHHQAEGGGDYAGIDTSSVATTGVTRTRTEYDGFRDIDVGDAVAALAAVEGGFDWAVGVDRVFRIYYPRRGTRRTEVTFSVENVLSLRRTRDASQQASRVLGFGDGSDESSVRLSRQDSAAVAKYGLTDASWKGSNIAGEDTLAAHVVEHLDRVKASPNVLSLTVRYGLNLPYGSFGLGDEVRVIYSSVWEDIDEYRRVVGIDTRPFPDETSVIHLTPIGG